MRACSLRAVWILGDDGSVLISRRFPTVERRWHRSFSANSNASGLPAACVGLPCDRILSQLYLKHTPVEKACYSALGRHVLCLSLTTETIVWPLVVLSKGALRVLVLPLVQPSQLLAQLNQDANNAGDLTSLSLAVAELTCVTQAVDVAEAILGLCTVTGGSATLSTGDCEKVREYIAGAMPFGTPLDTSAATTLAVRSKGFGTGDVATREQQPAWKPHLFQGRTKLHFVVREELQCWFHQELTPVAFSLAGCLDCR
ncbi:hypothetical protein CYMTET_30624 [Cymbomonas tetramitiformis]|uniref:Uncharacterized protein n=1 Tax=Cymbomonas tetramitiformis TaxID=36881 RepID=A0AAE0KTR6_9CHLO|nr:hypothetical protein CYMTET_30624 [Cymbomonas tetramitiformis]